MLCQLNSLLTVHLQLGSVLVTTSSNLSKKYSYSNVMYGTL
jgi:hypothetical protein